MDFEISADDLARLDAARAGRGVTKGLFLRHVLNALRESVPDEHRRQIRGVTCDPGTWAEREGERTVQITHIEAETTLRQCADALGLSCDEAFIRGLDRLVPPPPVVPTD